MAFSRRWTRSGESSQSFSLLKGLASHGLHVRRRIAEDEAGGDGDLFRGKTLRGALAGMRMTASVSSRRRLEAMLAENDWDCWLPNGIGLSPGDGCFAVSPLNLLSRKACIKAVG